MTTPATPVWQRLRRSVGEVGLLVTAQAAIDRLLSSLTGGRARLISYALMAQPVGAGAFANVRANVQTLLHELRPGDAMAAAMPRPADIYRQRWANGAQCLAATVKGEFAGMIWFARGQYDEDEVRCLYTLADAARSVWDYDVYVEPRFRARRLLARMWQAADAHLANARRALVVQPHRAAEPGVDGRAPAHGRPAGRAGGVPGDGAGAVIRVFRGAIRPPGSDAQAAAEGAAVRAGVT